MMCRLLQRQKFSSEVNDISANELLVRARCMAQILGLVLAFIYSARAFAQRCDNHPWPLCALYS